MGEFYIIEYIVLFQIRSSIVLFYITVFMGLFNIRDNMGLFYMTDYKGWSTSETIWDCSTSVNT